MEDLYVECLVARKQRAYETFVRGGVWGLTALFLIAGFFIHFLFLIGFVAMLLVCFFALPRLSVEYEYLYVSRSIEIDSIYSKEKRKKTAEYDLEQMEIFAEEGAWQLDEYKNAQTVNKDFTSGEDGVKAWILIVRTGQALERVRLEPDGEMIKAVKSVFPRKVFEAK
ncbi:MAG: hypothetical protein IJT24_07870 [Lachnospiraceae bacterium]|nr:hypothetical protein [Lachnospiraceae bacterium]